jgi:hypothetical protein
MADKPMSTTKTKAEALRILTAAGERNDPFAEGVENPDWWLQIVKESLDIFVAQNTQPARQSPEELAEAFLHHMDEFKRRPR